jgi:hypothetical protein
MADYKFDLFQALPAIDRNDGAWFGKQTADARKAFSAPVLIRWASSIAGNGDNHEVSLCMVNEYVNVNAGDIMTPHPEMIFRLAAMCGLGKKAKHEWIPMAGKNKSKPGKLYAFLSRFYPTANDQELDLILSQYDKTSFKEFVEMAGLTLEETKEVIKAYGKKEG